MREKNDGSGFFNRLRVLIAYVGMNQTDLAKAIEVDKGTVSRWKDVDNQPSLGSIVKICDATGASLEWLKDGVGPMFKYQPPPGDAVCFNFKTDPPQKPGEAGKVAEPGQHTTMDSLFMCKVVLESPGVYSTALASNALAFYTAVKNEEEMNTMREENRETNTRIANLERMMAEQALAMAEQTRTIQQLLAMQCGTVQKRDQKAG